MKVGVTQNNLEVNQAGWHITELLKLDDRDINLNV